MKRTGLVLLLCFFAGRGFSQTEGTIKVKKPAKPQDISVPKKNTGSDNLDLEMNYQYWKHSFFQLGVGSDFLELSASVNPQYSVYSACLQGKYYVSIGTKVLLIMFGPGIYAESKYNPEYALVPEIRFCINSHVQLGYGYNYIIEKRAIPTLNNSYLTLGYSFHE